MSIKEFGVLLALGAIWGASFMFIKVGGYEIQPFALVEMRLGLAALTMLLISVTRPGIVKAMLSNWRPLAVMGLINCAMPYTLITWGEVYIDSGLAAIFNAVAPLWAAGLTFVLPYAERLSLGKVVGLLVGLAGVILLVGGNMAGGSGGVDGVDDELVLVGQGACLLAALCYGLSGHYGRRYLKGVPLLAAATGQLVTGTIMLAPLAALQVPATMPSWEAFGSVIVLAIAGTALASLMYYWLLSRVGATKVLLVTYLLPGFALVWGALFLSEAVTTTALLGLGLVLLGIAITSGSGLSFFARFRSKPGKMAA